MPPTGEVNGFDGQMRRRDRLKRICSMESPGHVASDAPALGIGRRSGRSWLHVERAAHPRIGYRVAVVSHAARHRDGFCSRFVLMPTSRKFMTKTLKPPRKNRELLLLLL
jgi:hypothetical protein